MGYIKNEKASYFLKLVVAFFFIFGPYTWFASSSRIVYFFILIPVFLFFIFRKEVVLNKTEILSLLLLLMMFTIASIFPLYHETYDFTVPKAYLTLALESFFGVYILVRFIIRPQHLKDIFKVIVSISLIQALFIYSMLFFVPIRSFIFSLSNNFDAKLDLVSRYGGFRGLGFAHSTTYDLSIFLSIALMAIVVLIYYEPKKALNYALIWLLIFPACMLSGRTGYFGVVFSIVLMVFGASNRGVRQSVYYLVLGSVVALPILYFSFNDNDVFQRIINFVGELFINIFLGEGATTRSTEHLMTMYFPLPEKTILLGDGRYVDPDGLGYYMHTDAGYMREILYFGMFPMLINVIFYMALHVSLFKVVPQIKLNQLFVILIFIIFLLGQFKGSFFLNSAMNSKLYFLFIIGAIYASKKPVLTN